MSRSFRLSLLLTPLTLCAISASSQTAPVATAPLREIRTEGLKSVSEAQVAVISGLQPGAQTGKDDLQAAADKLVQSGLFAKVRYNFQSRTDGLVVTFHVEEAARVPAYFDNLPWFADSELNDAIRAKLPFYDGSLPEAGSVVDQAADAVSQFLVTHGLQAAVDLFPTVQIRPTFLQKGFLRANLARPDVRQSFNPNQKLRDKIPVFVP